jgi:hypothetical protein
MAATEERLKVLQMLEDGKITPEEASSLLRALGKGQEAGVGTGGPATEKRYLRIAERFAPEAEGIDMEELEQAIVSGAEGKIVEVMDAEDNERVEIYVE